MYLVGSCDQRLKLVKITKSAEKNRFFFMVSVINYQTIICIKWVRVLFFDCSSLLRFNMELPPPKKTIIFENY
jgi:hypothetical protein